MTNNEAAAVLTRFSGVGTNFQTLDCVRLACAMVAAARGWSPEDVAGVIGWREWTDAASAEAEVARFGGTLAGCLVKAAQRLDLVPISVMAATPGAIGLAAQRGIFGATVCVRGPRGWVTISGPEGLRAVEPGAILQVWRG